MNKMIEKWNTNDRRFIEIGLKIAYYRNRQGWSHEQMAEMIGLSSRYLSKVEASSSVQPISLKTLFAIADLFQVSLHKLLKFDE